jgi:transposase-like protein
MECPRCQSQSIVKNGCPEGRQRFKCNDCNRIFFAENRRKHPPKLRYLALTFVCSGLSFRRTALLLGLSPNTVYLWCKQAGEAALLQAKPEQVEIIELDEMWHYVQKKRKNAGSGKRLTLIRENSSTWSWALVPLKVSKSFIQG